MSGRPAASYAGPRAGWSSSSSSGPDRTSKVFFTCRLRLRLVFFLLPLRDFAFFAFAFPDPAACCLAAASFFACSNACNKIGCTRLGPFAPLDAVADAGLFIMSPGEECSTTVLARQLGTEPRGALKGPGTRMRPVIGRKLSPPPKPEIEIN